jgi:hypothetical protein
MPSNTESELKNSDDDKSINSNFEKHENKKSITKQAFVGETTEELGSEFKKAASIAKAIHKTSDEIENGYIGDKVDSSAIEDYAKTNDLWIEDYKSIYENANPVAGVESVVYISKDGKHVIKINNGVQHGSWEDFFYRIIAHNTYFPETSYDLIGYTKRDEKLAVIVKQPFIKIVRGATLAEIKKDLEVFGFEVHSINQAIDKHNGIILRDLHSENAVINDIGDVIYIDPIIQFIEDSLFLKELKEEL